MDAIALLEEQHAEVMEMMELLKESSPGRERNETFKKLQRALMAHMVIEEELLYPVVASRTEEGEPVAEGYEEHSGARVSMTRCARALKEDDLFKVRIGVLKEMISHHVKEEREAILPQVRQVMDANERKELGAQMKALFEKVRRTGRAGAGLNRKTTARELRALS
ncbi:MAG: hemerythrin domain-containing protein [Archangium sp.]|nr:hemerythrin domain-containing protein [Archangium sp.]MDP3153599.1 hemerythrin domain-containing protein [Archangium sp.]MDP3569333.1 hemerythrin domain-containing protein [Archangium sp.]